MVGCESLIGLKLKYNFVICDDVREEMSDKLIVVMNIMLLLFDFEDWKKLEKIDDLKRLEFVLENMPDKKLISKLSNNRNNGRNDYSITALWNSILAGIVYQHNSIESLRRELLRNFQLRILCGFESFLPANAWNYTRFLKNLFKFEDEIEFIFQELIIEIKKILPDFGSCFFLYCVSKPLRL